MEYNFRKIEKHWQERWATENVYKVSNISDKPKCYVLDMFPYPSGAGLHVGHPLGYIASDIYARFKRLKGFNVLHPMGYDSFGLPAEQYALETGQHPATTTQNNITTFRSQLENIGFSFDWSREVRTSDPSYYRWTQWIFLQIFNTWFDPQQNKARPIRELIEAFEKAGNHFLKDGNDTDIFSADDWKNFSEKHQQEILMQYRLAYTAYGEVNWCAALGTVLANDEVINGVSERGGYPVEKKQMRQWYMRITAYAERLLQGLDTVDFSDAMKEMQKNWIGKSEGAEIKFKIQNSKLNIEVYTTRPDTIFGVDFMVLAPEHELVSKITTHEQQQDIDNYLQYVKSRSERERLAEVKQITGAFTGAYAVHPFDGRLIPIWISEYVLAGYGTGAIMAVPCGDQRDFNFAKHFNISITNIIGEHFNGKEANPTKEAYLSNSGFLDGMLMRDAISVATAKLEHEGLGKRKINYKMRDAGFSRQRYWGEPFPIIYKDGIPYPIDEKDLPVELPHVESYSPGPEGQGPLANIKEWVLIPDPSSRVEKEEAKGAALVAKYTVSSPMQYELAKQMRKDHIEAEDKLWQELRNNKLGVKFRRQHPVASYITDFIALQNNLIVEVDGGYHENEEQKLYDEERTKVLTDIGFKVIRFTNGEVIQNINKVLAAINKEIQNNNDSTVNETSERSELKIPSPLVERGQGVRETNTMPGYAGSSWYFLRYMDPHNDKVFAEKKITDYWNQVDVYIGGTEHAVGHLLYSRMWTKVLCDLGYISFDEPFKKLVNQGMIQGSSRFVYRLVLQNFTPSDKDDWIFKPEAIIFLSLKQYRITSKFTNDPVKVVEYINSLIPEFYNVDYLTDLTIPHLNEIHVDVNLVDGVELDINAFRKSKPEYANATFILEDGQVLSTGEDLGEAPGANYICGVETEKMSKSKYNTVNPNEIIEKYGADTFRMYEMFLGPVEQSKPWDTKGIEGVHRFLRKLWRLFYDEVKGKVWNDDKPTNDELKILHRTIKKIEEDTEHFSYNTAVSAFMVCVNELTDAKCHKKVILEQLLILLAPYAPHITEELYQQLHEEQDQGKFTSILDAPYPVFEPSYLIESVKEYPVSINGKMRTTINISLDAEQPAVEQIVLNNDIVQKWIDGKQPKKIIYVKNKMINIVV